MTYIVKIVLRIPEEMDGEQVTEAMIEEQMGALVAEFNVQDEGASALWTLERA